MASLNRAQIIGRLGQDPESRQAGSSTVCRFSVATSEKWKDKQGQDQERTEWHRITVWGKLAEICQKYLSKGSLVFLEGKIQTRSWEDNGVTKYSTEIVGEKVQFLQTKQRNEPSNDNSGGPSFDDGEPIPF
jgi:single-strand DNA-binding protein